MLIPDKKGTLATRLMHDLHCINLIAKVVDLMIILIQPHGLKYY